MQARSHTRTLTRARALSLTHTCTHTHAHTNMHTHTCTHKHTHTHTHAHTHTHTCTHTHTYAHDSKISRPFISVPATSLYTQLRARIPALLTQALAQRLGTPPLSACACAYFAQQLTQHGNAPLGLLYPAHCTHSDLSHTEWSLTTRGSRVVCERVNMSLCP